MVLVLPHGIKHQTLTSGGIWALVGSPVSSLLQSTWNNNKCLLCALVPWDCDPPPGRREAVIWFPVDDYERAGMSVNGSVDVCASEHEWAHMWVWIYSFECVRMFLGEWGSVSLYVCEHVHMSLSGWACECGCTLVSNPVTSPNKDGAGG
jgi:hypothetical protein